MSLLDFDDDKDFPVFTHTPGIPLLPKRLTNDQGATLYISGQPTLTTLSMTTSAPSMSGDQLRSLIQPLTQIRDKLRKQQRHQHTTFHYPNYTYPKVQQFIETARQVFEAVALLRKQNEIVSWDEYLDIRKRHRMS